MHCEPQRLLRLYVDEGRSARDCGRELGVCHHTVRRALRAMKVPVRSRQAQTSRPFAKYNEPILRLHSQGWSGLRIARHLGISSTTVCVRLKRQGVDKQWRHPWTTRIDSVASDAIVRRYRRGETASEIGERLGYSPYQVLRELRRRGVAIRSPYGDYRNRPDVWARAEQISRMYAADMSTVTIGKRLRCSDDLIARILRAQGVHLRTTWRGGRTPLAQRLRSLPEYWRWSREVIAAHGSRCVISGRRSRCLHAHHLTPFAELIEDFVAKYPDLDAKRDVQTLCELAKSHAAFWDTSNGVPVEAAIHRRQVHVVGWPWTDEEIIQVHARLQNAVKTAKLLSVSPSRVRRALRSGRRIDTAA